MADKADLVRAFSTINRRLDRVQTASARVERGEPPVVEAVKESKAISEPTGTQDAPGQQQVDVQGDYQFTVVLRPNIIINMPEQKPPVVNVTLPEQKPPVVNVNVPKQKPPVVNVSIPPQKAPVVNMPEITVNVPEQAAPQVHVEIPAPQPSDINKLRVIRDNNGRIIGVQKE